MGKFGPQLENIFTQTLAIADGSERAAFVERVGGGDATLRRQVAVRLPGDRGAGNLVKATQFLRQARNGRGRTDLKRKPKPGT